MKHEMNQMQVRSLPWIAGGLLLVNLLLNILRSVQATGRFSPRSPWPSLFFWS